LTAAPQTPVRIGLQDEANLKAPEELRQKEEAQGLAHGARGRFKFNKRRTQALAIKISKLLFSKYGK
jgi:hypothetical protein